MRSKLENSYFFGTNTISSHNFIDILKLWMSANILQTFFQSPIFVIPVIEEVIWISICKNVTVITGETCSIINF